MLTIILLIKNKKEQMSIEKQANNLVDKIKETSKNEENNKNKSNLPKNKNEKELLKDKTNNKFGPFLKYPNQNNGYILDLESMDEKELFSKNNIFISFINQRMTKYLQKSLINASKETIDYILDELKGTFREVIKNKNGNYFCSNLIKVSNKINRVKILTELSGFLNEDCTDQFGTYPIQNLIELASGEDEFNLLLISFNDSDKILIPALNANGTFVIQKLIKHIPENLRTQFNNIFVNFVSILARDTYGAYALEKFIQYTKNEQIQKQILNTIMNDFINISTNKNGNYLIQNLLEKWWNNKKGENLKKVINSKFSILSKNVYSYYVCALYIRLSKSDQQKETDKTTINISKKNHK